MTVKISHDLRRTLGPIRDQGARPTCLAHATSVAHEASRGIDLPLSPEYLHYFSTKGVVTSGSTIADVRAALSKDGQPLESDCPYRPAIGSTAWTPPSPVEVFRRNSEPRKADVSEVESAISKGNVPVLGIALPDPFYIPADPWIIPATGTVRGLHAVAAVATGQLGTKRLVLVRNSWGSTWGDSGHAWLDEGFLGQHLRALLVLTHEIAA